MAIEITKNYGSDQTQNSKKNTERTTQTQLSQEEIKEFLRQYELKKLTLQQMYKIYAKNALTPYFQNTLKSALILIFLPALTNLYYTFRPNSPLARIMPFTMPIMCLTQYIYVINKDFQNFCFNESQDAAELRNKYKLLYAYSKQNKVLDSIAEDILLMEEKTQSKTSLTQ